MNFEREINLCQKILTIFICFQNQVEDFRKANNNIVVENFDKESKAKFLNPVMTFEQAFFNYPDIMSTINKQGFFKPSPIQAQAWPYLLSGKDLIGIAQTGTGKTLAFLVSVHPYSIFLGLDKDKRVHLKFNTF